MKAISPLRPTPTTLALLRWWFDEESIRRRGGHRFHDQQRRVIQDTIAAHETMNQRSLHLEQPMHRLELTEEAHQMEVLLALMVWQLLNHNDARAAGVDDARFTHHFITVASLERTREKLRQVFFGQPGPGGYGERDFGTSDLVRLSQRLIPTARQREVLAFVRANAYNGAQFTSHAQDHGVIALTDGRVDALECLARLPHAMVFDDDTRPPQLARFKDHRHGLAWRHHVRRFASTRHGTGVQVVFTPPPWHAAGRP